MHLSIKVRVYSHILDCGKEFTRLWHLCRAMDPGGSAKVRLGIAQIMAFFGISKATAYRWLSQGEGVVWHRNRSERSCIELHLIGIRRVCKNLQLAAHKDVLGAIAEVPLEWIATRFSAKATSTYIEALQSQAQAWWAASVNESESLRKYILKPWKRVACAISTRANETRTVEAKPHPKYAFMSEGWKIPGTTISRIRKSSNWKSDRTIQRRLSNTYRQERGAHPISKLRVAEEVDNPNMMAKLSQSCSGYVVEDSKVYKVLPFTNHEFWLLKYNIYGDDGVQLMGLRRLRGKANKFLDRIFT